VEIDIPDVDLHSSILVSTSEPGPPARAPEAASEHPPDLASPPRAHRRRVRRRDRIVVILIVSTILGFAAYLGIRAAREGGSPSPTTSPTATGTSPSISTAPSSPPPPASSSRASTPGSPTPHQPSSGPSLVPLLLVGAAVGLGVAALLVTRRSVGRKAGHHHPPVQPLRKPAPQAALEGRVLAGMRARRVSADLPPADDELRAWLLGMPDFAFDIVRLVCTFDPGEGEVIHSGTVALTLLPQSRTGSAPIVWSLDPKLVEAGEGVRTARTLGANLKFLTLSTSTESTRPARKPTVLGTGELQHRAKWVLTAQSVGGLRGDREFTIVVQRARGSAAICNLRIEVELEWSGTRATYRADLPEEAFRLNLAA
jgi:hypothetical protein